MKHRLVLGLLLLSLAACKEGSAESAPAKPAATAAVISVATRPTPEAIKALTLDLHILVDQFGYRPNDPKVAVLRSPELGFDAADKYSPGEAFEVRPANGGDAVFSGKPAIWDGGLVQDSSGDRGWWFDFSALTTPGEYVVVDVAAKRRSAVFAIREDVYQPVLKAALRTFFYQRSSFKKDVAHAGACWADEAAYSGPFQDVEARDIDDPDNGAKARDLSGGWFDAGDTNKYVTYASIPVHQLLGAWRDHPAAFGDDFNIPESGNGIPDVLDEVRHEINWLLKMQNPDGSVALKVGARELSGAAPPSSDKVRRYYIRQCTSSTIAAASMFAHAALAFRPFKPLEDPSTLLEIRAIKAWERYLATPDKQTSCDAQKIHAGDADISVDDQNGLAVVTAIYLYGLTGEARYDDYVKAHYRETRPYRDFGWSRYNPFEGEALLYYATLPNADKKTAEAIRADKAADIGSGKQIYGLSANDDLYRSFLHPEQYHWGSNQPRANYGNSNVDALTHGLAGKQADSIRARALGTLNWFHGVNPLGLVYLSNMASYGATRSATSIFHTWFWRTSQWSVAGVSPCGPVPGYVPGGPNASAAQSGVPAKLSPPSNQPPQKSYKDWNDDREAAWAISEPSISYQAAYIRLLSAFAAPTADAE